MKKLLLPLLIALLLTSCRGNSSSQVSSSQHIYPLSSSSIETSIESQASTTSVSSSLPNPVGIVRKSVIFYNGGFTNSSLMQDASQARFIAWFNDGDDVLASVEYSGYAQVNYVGNAGDADRFSTLILGSSNDSGSIKFNFNIQIVSVRVNVQPYTKYDSYHETYNIDRNATFIIDKKEYSLAVDESVTGQTDIKTIRYSFPESASAFTLANKEAKQRVFVHSLEITYWS